MYLSIKAFRHFKYLSIYIFKYLRFKHLRIGVFIYSDKGKWLHQQVKHSESSGKLCRRRPQITMGNNGFGNFWVGHTTGAGLGKQWETMDLVTFGLGIPLGAGLGSNGKQWIW